MILSSLRLTTLNSARDRLRQARLSRALRCELRLLDKELKRARIVAPENVPPDAITMNTRVELMDLETGEHMEFTFVLPRDENIKDGKISSSRPWAQQC